MTSGNDISIEIEAGTGSSTEADVLRCLSVLYGTTAGEQALDRSFGLDCDYLSAPSESAKALYAAEVIKKTATYEPRARVIRVDWQNGGTEDGQIKPKVVIEIV